jgi:hypothetical protein
MYMMWRVFYSASASFGTHRELLLRKGNSREAISTISSEPYRAWPSAECIVIRLSAEISAFIIGYYARGIQKLRKRNGFFSRLPIPTLENCHRRVLSANHNRDSFLRGGARKNDSTNLLLSGLDPAVLLLTLGLCPKAFASQRRMRQRRTSRHPLPNLDICHNRVLFLTTTLTASEFNFQLRPHSHSPTTAPVGPNLGDYTHVLTAHT